MLSPIAHLRKLHVNCYGQDSIAVLKLPDQLLLSLADGHGKKENGRTISYKIHEYLLSYLSKLTEILLEYLRTNNNVEITKIVVDMFGKVDNIILNHGFKAMMKCNKSATY